MVRRWFGIPRVWWGVGGSIALIIVLFWAPAMQPLRNLVGAVLAPPLSLVNRLGTHLTTRWTEQARQSAEWQVSSAEAQTTIDTLLVENTFLKRKLEAFQALDEQLAYVDQQSLSAVPARVISQVADGGQRRIIINQGSRDGLRVGQAVIVKHGVVIGKVSATAVTTAEVALTLSDRTTFTATLQNDQLTPCIVRGDRGLSLIADLIPQTDPLLVGQTVITSGLEEEVPPGLILGVVETITDTENQLFQAAALSVPTSFRHFDIVSVIIGS